MIDLRTYELSRYENSIIILSSALAGLVISYLMYRNILFSAVIIPFAGKIKGFVTDRIIKTEDEDLNTYTSGRIRIWKNYASKLNMLGNNFDEYDPMDFTGVKGLPFAHNIFLEIAYRCGIPVGLMAVLYYVICGIVCIKFLFVRSENKQPYLIFPIIWAITFALEALLDCAVLPFFQAEALLFYIAVAVMIDKEVS